MTLRERYRDVMRALNGDGCTSSPDLSYVDCCHEHDFYYIHGTDIEGNPVTRAEADRRLRLCMKRSGKTAIAGRWFLPWLYWAAVRLFGRGVWRKSKSSASQAMPSAPESSPD